VCHQEKPDADFAFQSINSGVRQDHCRACHAAYRRQHYLKNRDVYIAREVARMLGYRLDNRIRLFEYLSAHPCIDCGESDVLVLEFDHRDPSTKKAEVAHLAVRKPWKFVEAEILKCDVRCANCHRRRTATPFRLGTGADSRSEVKAPSPAAMPLLVALDPTALRECKTCNTVKSILEFSIKNKRTGRRAWRCHSCVAANSREHYQHNKDAYIARGRANKRKHRSRQRSRKSEYIRGLACVDCGETDVVVLEFDHRDASAKVDSVSRLMARHAWQKVLAEIEKCEIRCSNCHRKRTAEQFGWMKQSLQIAAKMAASRE